MTLNHPLTVGARRAASPLQLDPTAVNLLPSPPPKGWADALLFPLTHTKTVFIYWADDSGSLPPYIGELLPWLFHSQPRGPQAASGFPGGDPILPGSAALFASSSMLETFGFSHALGTSCLRAMLPSRHNGGFVPTRVNPISYQRFTCFSSTYFLVGAQATLRPQCCVIF